MFLISIYFDQKSNQKISSYMNEIATMTGNRIMTDGDVPPHITISSFDAKNEEQAREAFSRIETLLKKEEKRNNEVFFASVGSFVSGALFLTPVLDQFLQQLQEICYVSLCSDSAIKISRQYRPYSWFPHTSLAKKLTNEDMVDAFAHMHTVFQPFGAEVSSIGLAKTNPYRDLIIIEL